MSITAIIDGVLVEEAGRLGDDLYQRGLHTSPWLDMPAQEAWPEEMGESISVLVYERTLPGAPLVWKKMSGADNVGLNKSILPPSQTLAFGQTLREYSLEHTSLESPQLNINELRNATKRQEQLSAIRKILGENTDQLWIARNRSEYIRLCKHKLVASTASGGSVGFVDDNGATGAFPQVQSDTMLLDSLLTKIRQRMIRSGAGKNPLDRMDGAPLFGLILDSEVSDALKRAAGIVEDLRFAGRANELLSPLGVDRPYKNFFHIIDELTPHYTYDSVNHVYVEVPPYSAVNETFGQGQDENPAYDSAAYTVTIVWHADMYRMLIPDPSLSVGSDVKFDPVMYRGLWKWLNVRNVDKTSPAYNPDGTIGFFRGVFASGFKPVFPEFGYAIIHKRPGF